MKTSIARLVPPALLAALIAGCNHQHKAAGHDHDHEHPPSQQQPAASAAPAANPVQAEMRALNEVTRDWVTAIANNQLDAIAPGIHKVHAARLVTEAALDKGEYRPPKNGHKLEEFTRTDAQFHDLLVALLTAAKRDDLPGATKQLGVVLEGCTSCHREYRF
jgi:hypothetical protein